MITGLLVDGSLVAGSLILPKVFHPAEPLKRISFVTFIAIPSLNPQA
jgi:hypothetical protein